jgi:hypothetical protein
MGAVLLQGRTLLHHRVGDDYKAYGQLCAVVPAGAGEAGGMSVGMFLIADIRRAEV